VRWWFAGAFEEVMMGNEHLQERMMSVLREIGEIEANTPLRLVRGKAAGDYWVYAATPEDDDGDDGPGPVITTPPF
jgi:hypothetical protein